MVDIRTPNFGRSKLLRHIDFSIPLLALFLSGVGLLMIYSATKKPFEIAVKTDALYVQRQAIFLLSEEPTKELFIGGAIIIIGVMLIVFTKPEKK